MCKDPVAEETGACEAEAWGLRGRQAAAVQEGRLSTPRTTRDASREGKPAAFHTRKTTGSPPHVKDCSSSGVGARGEAGWEATAACGPGDRGGSKVAHLEVSEAWSWEAEWRERLGSGVGQVTEGGGAQGVQDASGTCCPPSRALREEGTGKAQRPGRGPVGLTDGHHKPLPFPAITGQERQQVL